MAKHQMQLDDNDNAATLQKHGTIIEHLKAETRRLTSVNKLVTGDKKQAI